MFKSSILAAGLALGVALATGSAHAQTYPSRPITIVVPYPAGGGGDVVARIVADALDKELKQRVIVENVTGAGGTIGMRQAAKAAPDGYTMVTMAPGNAAAPALYKDLGYDSLKSFDMVGLTGSSPIVLVVRGGVPAQTLREFIAYAKSNVKEITLGHAGPGSMTHLACSLFDSLIGINPVNVPYRGTPPLMQDLLGGRLDYTCQQPNGIIGVLGNGQLRALAVADDRRATSLPDVPTAAEAGLPAFKATAWNGLAMPKGTPEPILEKVNLALARVLDDPEVVKRFAGVDLTAPRPEQRTREYLRNLLQEETEKYTKLMREIGVEPQ